MSNHFSAANLRFPGDDTRLDLTDVYAFRSTEDPGKTVLIIDSNPTLRPPIELPSTVITSRDFHPGAVYRINIDTDGDTQADVAFTFTFSELDNGTQTGTAYHATGTQAREPGPLGRRFVRCAESDTSRRGMLPPPGQCVVGLPTGCQPSN